MRRSHRSASASSLELLLDTMCNAFGGVMFIAMLLAVMSHFAEVRLASEESGFEEALARRDALEAEVQRLRPQVRRRERDLETAGVLARALPLLDELREAERTAEALAEALQASEARIAEIEDETRAAQQKVREKETVLKELQDRSADLTDTLETRRQRTARELRMPRIRRIRKAPFWSIIKNDRLYVLYRPTRFFARDTVNTDAVRHTSYDGYADFDPIPGRGVDLEGDWQNAPDVRRLLDHVSTRRHILYFAVFPDSFGAFRQVRDFFSDQGYDYYWVVRPDMDRPLRLRFVTDEYFEGM